MSYLVVGLVALLASALTFYSGFGLGTLLLPAFALFFPVERAVAMTAVVHFLNGLFKLALTGRHADRQVVLRFGMPAILAAFLGAAVLSWLGRLEPLGGYTLFERRFEVTPIKLVIGLLLLAFATIEGWPRLRERSFGPKWLPLGGLLSGFFGGLSGHQGALRSAFLAKAGLSKEAFIASGVAIACLIDVSRLTLYAGSWAGGVGADIGLLTVAVLAAFVGAVAGNWYLKKLTMRGVQRVVTAMLIVIALMMIGGVV